jgi:hypothetical protein
MIARCVIACVIRQTMELSRDDIELLTKFFGEREMERVSISGYVRKGVLKIRVDVIDAAKVPRSLRAFIGKGKLLIFESG